MQPLPNAPYQQLSILNEFASLICPDFSFILLIRGLAARKINYVSRTLSLVIHVGTFSTYHHLFFLFRLDFNLVRINILIS